MRQNFFSNPAASGGRLRAAAAVLAWACVWVFGLDGVWAQEQTDSSRQNLPGGFPARGFEMKLAADGAPRFVRSGGGDDSQSPFAPQGSCGDGWDDRFSAANSANARVLAVVSDAAGNIYIGGEFTTVGNVAANNIAKWDGSKWSALGAGMNDDVTALEISGTDLYAGGYFTTAGGALARRVAKWDGSSWSPLGTGLTGNVFYDMTVVGTNVYASGYGLLFVPNEFMVVRWNGTSWSRVGGAFNSMPWTLAAAGTDVYVGGGFTTINGAPVSRIAKLNGSNWSPVGAGMNGFVRELEASGTDLYAGGEFTTAGGASANRIAKWSGSNWSPLGDGMNGTVNGLAVSGTNVYAGGSFTTAGGAPANRIAKWNGVSWSPLGAGMDASVGTLTVSGTDIYAGGTFTTAGCRNSSHFARYFNQQFIGGGNFSDTGGSDDWFTASNWSSGTVPAAISDATVAAADVSIASADATVRDLRVDEGRTVTVAAGRTLTVTRNLNLLGSITGAGTVLVSNCDPFALSRDSIAGGYVRTTLVRCVNSTGTYDFPVGTANGYSPVQMTNVAGTGNVSVLANEGAYSGAAAGLPANRLARWWRIENPSGGIAQTDLIFNYLPTDINGTEADYRAFRIAGGAAVQMPSSVNTIADAVTATGVTQFSDWTLAELAPTAASVTVAGRVLTANGRGLRNARVLMLDTNGTMRRATTSTFGYFRFDAVEVGQTYVFDIDSKRFRFAAQTVTINEAIENLNFTALP